MKTFFQNSYRNFIVRTFLFWLLLFFVMRVLFVAANSKFLAGSFAHKAYLFVAALRLDFAMAAYLTAPALLCWIIYLFAKKRLFFQLAFYSTVVLIVPVVFISLLNIGNYANWQTVANKRILLYFKNPSEVSHFMSTWQMVLLPILLIGLIWLTIFLHKKFVTKNHVANKSVLQIVYAVLCIPVFIVFVRGGVQRLPINESAVYYSVHEGNDHAAVNPVYYFTHSASEYFYVSSNYVFTDDSKNKMLIQALMREDKKDTIQITQVQKPNLVIILLESWTADVLEKLGGEKGVTPFTNSLLNESFLFTQCYGPGYRTDQGLVSVLAGYPSQPDNSIIAYPDKIKNMPALCKYLNGQQYNSSFFYGGDITFAEMKSFIVQQGFTYISDKENYDPKDYNSKWGAHDGKVLESQANYLNTIKQPFFSCVLTLSTHEPFEVPIAHKFPHDTDPGKFKNSAYYTDVCLRDYFTRIKKSTWYNNTLILLVADHGHHLPKERSLNLPESKRITCLLTGGALSNNLKGKEWNGVLNQHDLIKLLSPYYGYGAKNYPFAKNPFKASHPFAYYSNENVLGFVTDSNSVLYHIPTQNNTGDAKTIAFGKAYLQWIYKDFIER